MGQVREVDAISDAIIATEREIAGEAWGNEDTDALDANDDRSLEGMGDGLEGQHEAADEEASEDDGEGDDADGEDDESEQDEDEAEGKDAEGDGKGKEKEPEPKPKGEEQQRQPEGRVPSGKLREANERARALEAERDQLKADLEKAAKAPGDNRAEIETLKTQVSALTQLLQGQNGRQPPAKTEEPPAKKEAPDIFEDPKGFVEHITSLVSSVGDTVKQQTAAARVETSMAIAHGLHKETFDEAFAALGKLNPQNPDDRATVQRIYTSPNPGEALVGWHKRSKTLAEVGDDPAAFRARVAQETREALMKDPEFHKQLLANLRGDAERGGVNGAPRSETRLPRSLARQSGSNIGAERMDHTQRDDSEQAVADAAWRT